MNIISQLMLDRRNYYSPIVIGFFMIGISYLGLALIEQPGHSFLPSWIWLIGVFVFIGGVALQYLSIRILHIRLYQLCLSLYLAAIFGVAFIMTVTYYQASEARSTVTTLSVLLIFTGSFASGYNRSMERSRVTNMPHGEIGTLNRKTGGVDPTVTAKSVQESQNSTEKFVRRLIALSPLFVGILMAMTRVIGNEFQQLQPIIATLAGVILGGMGAGSGVFYLLSIRRWEAENQRHIYVQKARR